MSLVEVWGVVCGTVVCGGMGCVEGCMCGGLWDVWVGCVGSVCEYGGRVGCVRGCGYKYECVWIWNVCMGMVWGGGYS